MFTHLVVKLCFRPGPDSAVKLCLHHIPPGRCALFTGHVSASGRPIMTLEIKLQCASRASAMSLGTFS